MKMKKECQNVEYKHSLKYEYLKWVYVSTNADGGRMVIGARDGNVV